jgi:hypothetical protein
MNPVEPDLVHWRALPERKQALEFTAQGWALAEACTLIGEYEKPQALVVFMLSQIISGLVEGDPKNGPELNVDWQVKEGLTASIAFHTDALKALATVCDMEIGELQSAVQSSLELALLEMYDEHKGKQQLH